MKSRRDPREYSNITTGSSLIIVFIHSLVPLIGVFDRLATEQLGKVSAIHILDEPLLKKVQQQGKFLESDYERLRSHVHIAETISASIAIVTCSTFSPAVDMIRDKSSIPVLKIDENMIKRAVETGSRIGVIATASSTIQPTENALQTAASQKGKNISVTTRLVENALALLLKGDAQKHDEMVISAIQDLSTEVDLIVLAQASLARVLAQLPEEAIHIPVLASPILVLEQAREIINKPKNKTKEK